jgi:YidC/Oxa1 family membrane protein insertase
VGPASILLPGLLQFPVFLGLLHVLTSFTNPELANYAFGPGEVRSFLEARLFGVPLSAYLSMPHLDAVGVERWEVAVVTVPLVLLAALATHLADGPLAAIMRWTPWVFPLGVLVGGAFFPFPVAILLHWLTNSAWTLVQQWLVLRRPLQRTHLPAAPSHEGGSAAVPAPSTPRARVERRHSSGHRRSRRRR